MNGTACSWPEIHAGGKPAYTTSAVHSVFFLETKGFIMSMGMSMGMSIGMGMAAVYDSTSWKIDLGEQSFTQTELKGGKSPRENRAQGRTGLNGEERKLESRRNF